MTSIAVVGGAERAVLVVLASVTTLLAFTLLWSLRRVEKLVRHVDSVFVWQHRRRTPVATIAGLVGALEKGLEQGELTPEQLRAIYVAINEQLELFYRLDEIYPEVEDSDDNDPRGTLVSLRQRLRGPQVQEGSGIAHQAAAAAQS